MYLLIISSMLFLSSLCVIYMVYQLQSEKNVILTRIETLKLGISGVIAFIADTIGIGSFAVNIALAKAFNTFSDEQLPPMVNGAQIVPGVIESIFFMQTINVDKTTLLTLVIGTCIGGLLGGKVVSKLSKQAIRFAMVISFSLIIGLLISKQMQWLPIGGHLTALHSTSLYIAFFAMIICGGLSSVGIGLFALIQGVLFLLNVSPVVAFPIMTTAGAMQQPLTTLIYLKQKKIQVKKTLIVSLGGCVGVLMVLPIFKYLTTSWLHMILVTVLCFNVTRIGKAFFQERKIKKQQDLACPTSA